MQEGRRASKDSSDLLRHTVDDGSRRVSLDVYHVDCAGDGAGAGAEGGMAAQLEGTFEEARRQLLMPNAAWKMAVVSEGGG